MSVVSCGIVSFPWLSVHCWFESALSLVPFIFIIIGALVFLLLSRFSFLVQLCVLVHFLTSDVALLHSAYSHRAVMGSLSIWLKCALLHLFLLFLFNYSLLPSLITQWRMSQNLNNISFFLGVLAIHNQWVILLLAIFFTIREHLIPSLLSQHLSSLWDLGFERVCSMRSRWLESFLLTVQVDLVHVERLVLDEYVPYVSQEIKLPIIIESCYLVLFVRHLQSIVRVIHIWVYALHT